MSVLPALTFDEIALRLMHLANEAARACADGELIVARMDPVHVGLGVRHWLEDKRTSAVMAGQVLQFFKAMAPHEEQFRDFVAGLEASAPAAIAPMRSAGRPR